MKLRFDFSLPKLVKLRVGVQLGLDIGAKFDVRMRVRGLEPLRWKAAIARGEGKKELPAAELPAMPVGREPPRA
jgi:hypothetical protein